MVLILLAISTLATYINVFSDKFNNLNNWVAQNQKGQDTGNNEWQYYTNRNQNVYVSTQGLILKAKQEQYDGYKYTSGKVISKDPFGPYGFFNIKAKVPKGEALWPAIWLLPPHAHSKYGSWAACGEIDIMETICTNTNGYSTLHFGGEYPHQVQYPTGGANAWSGVDWNEPHWFGVEWQPTYMQFWLDAEVIGGEIKNGRSLKYITSHHWFSEEVNGSRYPGNAPFDTEFSIILNVAIGGNWPCGVGCCGTPSLPAYMQVYQVDVWEKQFREEE